MCEIYEIYVGMSLNKFFSFSGLVGCISALQSPIRHISRPVREGAGQLMLTMVLVLVMAMLMMMAMVMLLLVK